MKFFIETELTSICRQTEYNLLGQVQQSAKRRKRQLPHRAGGERAPSLARLPSTSASTVHILFISLFHCPFTVHPRINSAGAHPLVDFIGHALMMKDYH